MIRNKEFERFFDTTPGPGSYNLMEKLTRKVSDIAKESTDYSQTIMSPKSQTEKQSTITKDSGMEKRHHLFQPKSKGTFGFEKRLKMKPQQSPGPGQYKCPDLEIESNKKRS